MVTSLHVITTCYNNWFSAEYYRYTIYFSNMNWSRSLVLITDSRSWHFDQSILIISNNYLPDLSDYYFWKIRQNPIIYSHFFLKNLWLPLGIWVASWPHFIRLFNSLILYSSMMRIYWTKTFQYYFLKFSLYFIYFWGRATLWHFLSTFDNAQ